MSHVLGVPNENVPTLCCANRKLDGEKLLELKTHNSEVSVFRLQNLEAEKTTTGFVSESTRVLKRAIKPAKSFASVLRLWVADRKSGRTAESRPVFFVVVVNTTQVRPA